MGARSADGIIQTLCKLAEPYGQLTDGQLLERFAAQRDERAFAELLNRHGGLVYAVCRNILRNEHDAEDAFQGTFLVLARRAGAIQEAKAVAGWLYRVAYRVAMKARQTAERRRNLEGRIARPVEGERTGGEIAWRELQAMLDDELIRLPDKYRTPFVLCCLLGKSKTEAAAELGWKTGTVSSRLAHARKLLQTRLARRGVTLSALLSGLAITERNTSAAVPVELLQRSCRAALDFASSTASTAAAASPVKLAQSVLRGMDVGRLKVAAMVAVLFGLVGTAAVAVTRPPSSIPPAPPDTSTTERAPAALIQREIETPSGKLMTVGGSVLGLDGKPVAGSRVAVVAYRYAHPREMPGNDLYDHVLLGEGAADDNGNYRLTVPQTTAWNYRLTVVAGAPGYALGSRAADPTTTTHSAHTIPVHLVRGHTARVRFVDADGRPVEAATVTVAGMSRNGPAGLLTIRYGGINPLPGWPGPQLTDSDGCVVLHDVGPETDVLLHVHDDRFAPDWHRFRTGAEKSPDPVQLSLAPARVLEGRVLAEDTHMPIGDAVVVAETTTLEHNYICIVSARTGPDGRYRLNPFRGSRIGVRVYPPDDVPYLVPHVEFPWSDTAPSPAREIFVPRGVLVRGVVREARSGRPVAGASVSHEWSYENNPFLKAARGAQLNPWPTRGVLTRADGSYSITVPPGPGFLLVKSPEPEYVHVETSTGRLDGGRGGTPCFFNAVEPVRLAPAAPPVDCPITLREGLTLRGRVVGADAASVANGIVLSPTYIPEGFQLKGHPLPILNGRFALPGVEPESSIQVAFLDREKKEGAVAVITARSGEEPEIRLAPCVSARVRIGGPAATGTARISAELVFRPGQSANETFDTGEIAELAVGTDRILGAQARAIKDRTGDLLLPNLIPGALYTIRVDVPGFSPERIALRAPLSVSSEPSVIVVEPKKIEEKPKKR